MNNTMERLSGKLIVSCQALPDEPLYGSVFLTAMARAAAMGGASGIRANGADNIAAIRAAVPLPIFGINKRRVEVFAVFITPDYEDARLVVEAGADVVAPSAVAAFLTFFWSTQRIAPYRPAPVEMPWIAVTPIFIAASLVRISWIAPTRSSP